MGHSITATYFQVTKERKVRQSSVQPGLVYNTKKPRAARKE